MKMPEIDAYIAEFEKLVRKANYTLGSPEMNQHFIAGLPQFITEDVLKDPEPTTYPEILRKTLASVRTKQTIWALYKRGGQNQNQPNTYQPPQNNWRSQNFPHDGCKTRLSQWTLAIQEHPTVDEEEEEPSEGEEANTDNTTINPRIVSKIMLRPREIRQTPVSNVDK